jgi:hypothetical protein
MSGIRSARRSWISEVALLSGATRRSSPVATMISNRFARIEGDLLVLKWMTGTVLAGVVALVIKTFIT